MKPLVTVIIPTYNREKFVIEAIESVLCQSYENIELIVVDDGSTDKTFQSVTPYLIKGKLRYIHQNNRGVSSARNCGIKLSRGDYITFLDSDDLWDKRKLEKQIGFLESHKEFSVCYTNEIWIRNGVRVNQKKVHQKYGGSIYKQCLPLCIISASSIMLKREVVDEIGLFDESLTACEDYDYWLRLSSEYQIHLMAESLMIKRAGHNDQLSYHFKAMDRFRVRAMVKMLESGQLNKSDYHETVHIVIKKCNVLITGYEKRNNVEESLYYQSLIDRFS